ncbi:MAG TPA: DUF924 family protein [Cellvibrionaceae bacterium]
MASYQTVLNFWFKELTPEQWFKKDATLDKQITERFSGLLLQASQCELFSWRDEPKGRLAEIIVLDQFSRNIFRDTSAAFATDPLALALAQEAVTRKADQALTTSERSFLYMPYMHSESAAIHALAMQLFNQPGLENNLEFERKHKDIIDRFGRYPHRNTLVGRTSTDEELAFLQQPGSGF